MNTWKKSCKECIISDKNGKNMNLSLKTIRLLQNYCQSKQNNSVHGNYNGKK